MTLCPRCRRPRFSCLVRWWCMCTPTLRCASLAPVRDWTHRIKPFVPAAQVFHRAMHSALPPTSSLIWFFLYAVIFSSMTFLIKKERKGKGD